MRDIRCSLAALLLGGLPAVAHAADLRSSYYVDATAFKEAVVGTTFTYSLYADSACTEAASAPVVVAVEDIEIVSRLKLAKTGDAKPPKALELVHTLSGVTTSSSMYLQVTGTGIAAVGGDCQPQAVAFPDVLRGTTLRGAWVVFGDAPAPASGAYDSVSFGVPLSQAPQIAMVPYGGPSTPQCPGTADAPEAQPGYFCLYEGSPSSNKSYVVALTPTTSPSAKKFGVVVYFETLAAGPYFGNGTWAVTAP